MVRNQVNGKKITGAVGSVAQKISERLETELAGHVRQNQTGASMDWDELVDDCENILAAYRDYMATNPSDLRRLNGEVDLGWRVADGLECFYSDAESLGTDTAVGTAARQIINDELRLHGLALCRRGYLPMGDHNHLNL